MEKELEVKVLGIDIKKIEEKIIDLKGQLIADEVQVNTLIDSKARPIKESLDAYLRIRETEDLLSGKSNVVLTLKKNIENENLRENIELNSEIEDKETVLEILKSLGFDNIKVGYKERKSYRLNRARIDLDRWDKETYPFPYVEIEVESHKHLNEIVDLLEIPRKNISNKSIIELQKELKII